METEHRLGLVIELDGEPIFKEVFVSVNDLINKLKEIVDALNDAREREAIAKGEK